MNNLLKVIAISDTHMQPLGEVLKDKKADLLVIAGDMTFIGSIKQMMQFKADLLEVRSQFNHCCWVLGNHEREMDPARGHFAGPQICEEIAKETNSDWLHNSGVTYTKGNTKFKVWGSPVTPTFFDWGFLKDRGAPIAKVWREIPEGLSILVTHGPAHGILDKLPWSGEHVGCEELRHRLDSMEQSPLIHISGHIHCAHGAKLHRTPKGNNIQCYNVAICSEEYKAENPPTEFYLRSQG